MAATATILETNGPAPGKTAENVISISWKGIDDSSTSYNSYTGSLTVPSNSYTSFNFVKFSGPFNAVGNVKITNTTGVPFRGVKLMAVPSSINDAGKTNYSTPNRLANNTSFTNLDISAKGSYISLLVGPSVSGFTGPTSPGKMPIMTSNGQILYTNYFITQLQVSPLADTGDFSQIVLQLTYEES